MTVLTEAKVGEKKDSTGHQADSQPRICNPQQVLVYYFHDTNAKAVTDYTFDEFFEHRYAYLSQAEKQEFMRYYSQMGFDDNKYARGLDLAAKQKYGFFSMIWRNILGMQGVMPAAAGVFLSGFIALISAVAGGTSTAIVKLPLIGGAEGLLVGGICSLVIGMGSLIYSFYTAKPKYFTDKADGLEKNESVCYKNTEVSLWHELTTKWETIHPGWRILASFLIAGTSALFAYGLSLTPGGFMGLFTSEGFHSGGFVASWMGFVPAVVIAGTSAYQWLTNSLPITSPDLKESQINNARPASAAAPQAPLSEQQARLVAQDAAVAGQNTLSEEQKAKFAAPASVATTPAAAAPAGGGAGDAARTPQEETKAAAP